MLGVGNPGLERPKGSAAEPPRPGKLRGFPAAAAAASRRDPRPPNGAGPPPNRGTDNADCSGECPNGGKYGGLGKNGFKGSKGFGGGGRGGAKSWLRSKSASVAGLLCKKSDGAGAPEAGLF